MATLKHFLFAILLCSANCRYSSAQKVLPTYLDYLLNSGSYDDFVNILQIPTRDLVDPSQRKTNSVYQFFYNGLEFGDILLRNDQIQNPDPKKDFNGVIKYSLKKWTNGTVPYYTSNALTDDQRQYINREISNTNRLLAPNVVFRQYTPGDIDYVYIFQGGSGWFTNIGNVGGAQVISINPPLVEGLFTHELQHTLGFGHTHNRIDRDQYINIHPVNISQALKPQFIKFTADNLMNLEPYDYYSILSYPPYIFVFNTIAFDTLLRDTNLVIEDFMSSDKLTLKDSDIQRVRNEYPLLK